jgi:hypothetical protein
MTWFCIHGSYQNSGSQPHPSLRWAATDVFWCVCGQESKEAGAEAPQPSKGSLLWTRMFKALAARESLHSI